MAGSLRQRGEGSWQLRVHVGRDPETGRKRYAERTFHGTKRQAERALAALVAESESMSPAIGSSHTVERLLTEWLDLAGPSLSPRTVVVTKGYIDKAIVPAIGSIPVSRLTTVEIDRFYRQLAIVGGPRRKYSPATIRRVHGILRRVSAQGVRWGWIRQNPAVEASPPRVPLRELKPPTPGEVAKLFRIAQESDPTLAMFVVLAASTGARRGEVLALRWSDVELRSPQCPSSEASSLPATSSSSKARRLTRVAGLHSTGRRWLCSGPTAAGWRSWRHSATATLLRTPLS